MATSKMNPIDELRIQIDAVVVLIDEIIHLDAMRKALENAKDKLLAAQQDQRDFYISSSLPLTPYNLKFLNATVQGKGYQQRILNINRDVNSIERNLFELQQEKAIRIKPFNDLWDHVTNQRIDINRQYISTLLNNAKVLNPEGSFGDIIKAIGNILQNIITLRCYEVPGIYHVQKTKNTLRSRITGFFKRDFSEAKSGKESGIKPGHSR